MSEISVLIVDDHSILRMGLASLLSSKSGIRVAGDASSGPTGIRKALKLRPDVVIMDLAMPGMDGAEATAELVARIPGANVLVLTTFGTSDGISRALDAGAKGAVMKNCDFGELVGAIRKVAAGGRYVSPEVDRLISADPPAAELSPRQREILQSIVRGLSNPEIARQLGISVDVVKEHTESMFQKIGAANRAEAVAIAFRKHLVDQ
ncbi:MAG: response regulator transcription factor [Kiritimatiellae bacterium]|nr:response regulator transcription factor [Kiritimatiellia bacterium]